MKNCIRKTKWENVKIQNKAEKYKKIQIENKVHRRQYDNQWKEKKIKNPSENVKVVQHKIGNFWWKNLCAGLTL